VRSVATQLLPAALAGLVVLASLRCMPALDRTSPCGDTGPRPDRTRLDAPADAPGGDLPPDRGSDQKLCSSATECDDGVDCTDDTCSAGACSNKIKAGYCLIGGVCFAASTANSDNTCQSCDPTQSASDWTSTPQCVATLAGTGNAGFKDGPASAAQFNDPTDVAVDSVGQVHIADYDNHRIRVLASGQVTTFAGSAQGWADGPALQAKFYKPMGVWLGPSGVYVADQYNDAVRLVSGGMVTTFNTGFELYGPAGGDTGASGEIYVSDTIQHRIAMIPFGGGALTNVAGVKGQFGHVDGAAAAARFEFPLGLALDAQGTVFVADTNNHCIRAIKSGQVSTFAGVPKKDGHADGAAATATFRYPRGVAVDAQGTVYVGDTENNLVRMIKGGQVSTLAGTGQEGLKDGAAASAEFDWPCGVDVDAKGNVYVADTENHAIRLITK